jgi:hypothetical protein
MHASSSPEELEHSLRVEGLVGRGSWRDHRGVIDDVADARLWIP